MKKKSSPRIRRQGDILFVKAGTRRFDGSPTAASIPASLVPADRDSRGRLVLAEGETTGHAHAILDPEVELFVQADLDDLADRWLRIEKEHEATVVHEEHGAFSIHGSEGDTIVRRKREYRPEAPAPVYD